MGAFEAGFVVGGWGRFAPEGAGSTLLLCSDADASAGVSRTAGGVFIISIDGGAQLDTSWGVGVVGFGVDVVGGGA